MTTFIEEVLKLRPTFSMLLRQPVLIERLLGFKLPIACLESVHVACIYAYTQRQIPIILEEDNGEDLCKYTSPE